MVVLLCPTSHHEWYIYVGIDENMSYQGTENKDWVNQEYYTRVKKMWCPENPYNTTLSHNTVKELVSTFWDTWDWSLEEIHSINIKTPTIQSSTDALHKNKDIHRFSTREHIICLSLLLFFSKWHLSCLSLRAALGGTQNQLICVSRYKESNTSWGVHFQYRGYCFLHFSILLQK